MACAEHAGRYFQRSLKNGCLAKLHSFDRVRVPTLSQRLIIFSVAASINEES